MNLTPEIIEKIAQSTSLETLQKLKHTTEVEKRFKGNEVYNIYREFKGRYAILIGGAGSGKSYEVADKHIKRFVEEDKHRILCVRAQRNQVSDSQFPLLENRLKYLYKEHYEADKFKINRALGQEKIVYEEKGNEIIFAGLDDVEKLKSIYDITSVWVEESDQVIEKDLRELDRRLRGYQGTNSNGTEKYMQITLSFNPVNILNWIKPRFFDSATSVSTLKVRGIQDFEDFTYYKDLDWNNIRNKLQITHEEKIQIGNNEFKTVVKDYNTLLLHSTYIDNKFIDSVYMQTMESLKEHDLEEYRIYAQGQWGVTGGTFFDKEKVNARIQANIKPIKQGFFDFTVKGDFIDDIKWIDDPDGMIKIYKEPQEGYPYVGSGDTAGEGSDWNVGYFTDNTTGEDVATLRTQYDEDLYARQMYCLGMHYNEALLGIEVNFSTHPQKELERFGYNNFYIREESPDAYTGNYKKKFGFRTDSKTRPLMLGELRQIVREKPYLIKDIELLYEMTTFVKNEKGRPEAAKGAHDDMVMARAIAVYISREQDTTVNIKNTKQGFNIRKLPEDMQEDYYNASPEYRKMLERLWKDYQD